MNLVLLLVLVAQACLGVCAWLTPQCLRWLAAHLLTRADVLTAARSESERRMSFWRGELGLDTRSLPPDASPALEPVPEFVRR